MDASEALRIVRMLAAGFDPSSGEGCLADSVFQQPQTVLALERAAEALQLHIKRSSKRKAISLLRNKSAGQQLPLFSPIFDKKAEQAGPGKPWMPEEDAQLCAEFYRSVDFNEMADHLGRTKSSIFCRLVALGKIRQAPPTAA